MVHSLIPPLVQGYGEGYGDYKGAGKGGGHLNYNWDRPFYVRRTYGLYPSAYLAGVLL